MTFEVFSSTIGGSNTRSDEHQPLIGSIRPYEDGVSEHGDATATTGATEDGNSQLLASRNCEFYTKLIATSVNFFVSGFAMAAIGALLPDIEERYNVTDAEVALVFPAGVLGYLFATSTVKTIESRGGRRAIAVSSTVIRLVGAASLGISPPFFVVFASFAFFGYGTGATDTAWNTWAGGMRRANVIQGILHGSFAVGCVLGPLVAAPITESSPWAAFYRFLCLLLSFELLIQSWAFRHDARMDGESADEASEGRSLRSTLFQRSVWIMSLFYFFYQCVEACYTDWIVTFIGRHSSVAPASAAIASSVFWIGMAVGRYSLGFLTEYLGVRLAVVIYCISTMILQLWLTFVSQIGTTLVLIGGCGFFLAPLFPSGIVLLAPHYDLQQRGVIIAFLIAMGQIGAAVAPLAVGILATRLGIQYLIHVTLGFSSLTLVAWLAVLHNTGDACS